ncbi:MAG: chromate efflux transporter [Armatimonadota bacterium]|nr:chromate efflux transporter [Armatimonadota bacterium]
MADAPASSSARGSPLGEVTSLFLRLGCTAFGGPAAHIAMMREEVVMRRRWLTDQEFLDLLGATNLIPGPNSTEMAIHLGYRRAGWPGLIAGGAAFIVPAMLIVMALAAVYARYGTTPQATWLLYGVKPVIVAIVVQAIGGLARTALRGPLLAGAGVAALALYLSGVNEIALLVLTGLAVMLWRNLRPGRRVGVRVAMLAGAGPLAGLGALAATAAAVAAPDAAVPAVPFTVGRLVLVFLKIGSVLYGSGYVLLAFLHADFVERLRWLTDRQLLEAVAVGQVTPGPVFTTATFVGYVLGGVPAAVAATVAIFLPGFVFVAASHPVIPRLRRSPWAGALLDGVNVASLALMAGVAWTLGRAAITDGLTAGLAVVTLVVLLRFRLNSAWLVAGGALVGFVAGSLR